jgi:hypothetical protein
MHQNNDYGGGKMKYLKYFLWIGFTFLCQSSYGSSEFLDSRENLFGPSVPYMTPFAAPLEDPMFKLFFDYGMDTHQNAYFRLHAGERIITQKDYACLIFFSIALDPGVDIVYREDAAISFKTCFHSLHGGLSDLDSSLDFILSLEDVKNQESNTYFQSIKTLSHSLNPGKNVEERLASAQELEGINKSYPALVYIAIALDRGIEDIYYRFKAVNALWLLIPYPSGFCNALYHVVALDLPRFFATLDSGDCDENPL